MIQRHEITEAMISAAINASLPAQITVADMRKILAAGLSKLPNERCAPYPLLVSDSLTIKRARFVSVTERRCYYRVETEDGKVLTLHGNDIQPSNRAKP